MRGRIVRLGIVLGIIFAVAPALPAAAGSGCHDMEQTTEETAVVVMERACFFPTIARIPIHTSVRFLNKDAFTHTVTGVGLAWGDLEEIGRNVWKPIRFESTGIYPYYCFLHPGMAGAIVVGDGGLGTLTKSSSTIARNAITDVSDPATNDGVRTAAARTAVARSPWPAIASAIGLASMGLGFVTGRRMRHRHGRRQWEPLEPSR